MPGEVLRPSNPNTDDIIRIDEESDKEEFFSETEYAAMYDDAPEKPEDEIPQRPKNKPATEKLKIPHHHQGEDDDGYYWQKGQYE